MTRCAVMEARLVQRLAHSVKSVRRLSSLLIARAISMIRESGMMPVSACHLTNLSLLVFKKEDIAVHWLWANKRHMCADFEEAVSVVRTCRKHSTTFRVHRGLRLPEQIPEAYSWLRDSLKISSVVVGIDDESQGAYTVPMARSVFCGH